jgi:hypothetical protein
LLHRDHQQRGWQTVVYCCSEQIVGFAAENENNNTGNGTLKTEHRTMRNVLAEKKQTLTQAITNHDETDMKTQNVLYHFHWFWCTHNRTVHTIVTRVSTYAPKPHTDTVSP